MKSQIKELLGYLWTREKWWIAIIMIILILLGGLMIFAECTPAISPFIYAIF